MLLTIRNKNQAIFSLLLGALLPLTIFLLLTWLHVKYDVQVLHADVVYWVIYALIALPLFWYGLDYLLPKSLGRGLATLGLAIVWAVVSAISLFFFHLGIGGTL